MNSSFYSNQGPPPTSLNNGKDPFFFNEFKGGDESMKDYAKMCILLSLQPPYKTTYDMCKMISTKFKDRYPNIDWSVIIYPRTLKTGSSVFNLDGDFYIYYKDYFIDIDYLNDRFVIFANS